MRLAGLAQQTDPPRLQASAPVSFGQGDTRSLLTLSSFPTRFELIKYTSIPSSSYAAAVSATPIIAFFACSHRAPAIEALSSTAHQHSGVYPRGEEGGGLTQEDGIVIFEHAQWISPLLGSRGMIEGGRGARNSRVREGAAGLEQDRADRLVGASGSILLQRVSSWRKRWLRQRAMEMRL